MTEPDGHVAGSHGAEPLADAHLDDPLLPTSRVAAEPPADAEPAPHHADDDLGGWFENVERQGPSAQDTLRHTERSARRSTPARSAGNSKKENAARAQVYAIAAVAALVAALAEGRPTGLAAWDLILRMGLAFGVTVACSHARRW